MKKSLLLTAFTTSFLLTSCGQAAGQVSKQDVLLNSAVQSRIDWSALGSYEHKLSNESLTITRAGTHMLSGKSTASVIVNSDDDVRLILSGVDIHSKDGAAIYISNADNTVIELAAGTQNTLEDASTRQDDAVNGTIYSSDDLMFQGAGTLNVIANFQDGIVSKDDLEFYSGEYNISAVDDGIRGKDSLLIAGGVISVTAKGDGIKSSNDDDPEKGNIHITGGSLTIDSGDDGLAAVNNILIDAGQVNVVSSVEGMEASTITINGGDISVYASDDGINAVNDNGLGNMSITVNGGNIDVAVAAGDTDAFDSNGTILIAGGNINVTAPRSAFDSDRGSQMTGGTVTINGQLVTQLPSGRGGRGGGGRRGGMGGMGGGE